VFMFCWKCFLFLDRLDSVLVMVNFTFVSNILVDLLGLGGSDGFVSRFRFDFGVDGCIVVFTRGKDLLSVHLTPRIYVLDFIHCKIDSFELS
jgi:hypothetical protein